MIHSTQKVIRIGSSGGITIPAKEMKRQNIQFGDDVEVTIRLAKKDLSADDQQVIATAKAILSKYQQAFTNLAKR
jgi:antitoxin component of MazEF toxin-antitoxin module